jgi:hypothetical protein
VDNLIEFISAIPVVVATVLLAVVYTRLWHRLKADKHFIRAVSEKLSAEAEKLPDNDPNAMRHLYLMSLLRARKSKFGGKNQPTIFGAAMNDLADRDRRFIKSTLKNSSDIGRVRYLDKVFNAALKQAAH